MKSTLITTGIVAAFAAIVGTPSHAQVGALAALGAPPAPRVQVSWDRYYDHAAIGQIAQQLQQAWPNRCRAGSIGTSYEGRELWLITVTNFDQDETLKPAMYIDGNIHSNEVQGAETALYTAWYLCEMADRVPYIDSLLDRRVFYIIPTINPDGREAYLKAPNTGSSPRAGMAPRDNDGDGLVDEDGYDDLDGDGHITQMRRRSKSGRYIVSPEDPRLLIPAAPGQQGEYELLGLEGIDNDGDGFINEDGAAFSYDPNRNWPWRWQPQYVQGGSDYYPTSLPETQAVIDFVINHPNIAGAQSYHNSGGMILRGPGVPEDELRPQDVRVMDAIGNVGEEILPGYRYMVVWSDLYIVWGGELDWFYGAQGILTFSNELFTPFKYFEEAPTSEQYDRVDYRFDRLLLFGEAFVPWREVQHPQFGTIEVGGMKKNFGRAVPAFLLPAEAHRNMAFTIFHADHLPQLEVDTITTRRLAGGLTEVTAVIGNRRLVPTHTQQDVENRITRPDWVTLDGGVVMTGAIVPDPRSGVGVEQRQNPARIEVPNIPGMGSVTVRWVVQGTGPFTVSVDSVKGGIALRTGR
jgi:hypothetical protein